MNHWKNMLGTLEEFPNKFLETFLREFPAKSLEQGVHGGIRDEIPGWVSEGIFWKIFLRHCYSNSKKKHSNKYLWIESEEIPGEISETKRILENKSEQIPRWNSAWVHWRLVFFLMNSWWNLWRINFWKNFWWNC